MYRLVKEFGIERGDLQGIAKERDMIEVRCREEFKKDIAEYNNREDATFIANKPNQLEETVRLRGFPIHPNPEHWNEPIGLIMFPYAKEIMKIERSFWGKNPGNGFFEGLPDGCYDVTFIPRLEGRRVPAFIPFGTIPKLLQIKADIVVGARRIADTCYGCYREGHRFDELDKIDQCLGAIPWADFAERYYYDVKIFNENIGTNEGEAPQEMTSGENKEMETMKKKLNDLEKIQREKEKEMAETHEKMKDMEANNNKEKDEREDEHEKEKQAQKKRIKELEEEVTKKDQQMKQYCEGVKNNMVGMNVYNKEVEKGEKKIRNLEKEKEMLMKKISNKFALTDTGRAMNEINNRREELEDRKREMETELEKEDEQSTNKSFLGRSDNNRMELAMKLEKIEEEKKKIEEDREKLVETVLGDEENGGNNKENLGEWNADWEEAKEKELQEIKEKLEKTEDELKKLKGPDKFLKSPLNKREKKEEKKETEKLRERIREMEKEKTTKEEEEIEERKRWREEMEKNSNDKMREEISKKEMEFEMKQNELMEQFAKLKEQLEELNDSTAEQLENTIEMEQKKGELEQETEGLEQRLDMLEYQLKKGRLIEPTGTQLLEQIAAIDEIGISDGEDEDKVGEDKDEDKEIPDGEEEVEEKVGEEEDREEECSGFRAVEVESLVRRQEIGEKIQDLEKTIPTIEVSYTVEPHEAEVQNPEGMEEGDEQTNKKRMRGNSSSPEEKETQIKKICQTRPLSLDRESRAKRKEQHMSGSIMEQVRAASWERLNQTRNSQTPEQERMDQQQTENLRLELSPTQRQEQTDVEGEETAKTKGTEDRESQDMFVDSQPGDESNESSQCGQVWGGGLREDEMGKRKQREKKLSAVEEESNKSGPAGVDEAKDQTKKDLPLSKMRLAISDIDLEIDTGNSDKSPTASTPKEIEPTKARNPAVEARNLRDRDGPGCRPPGDQRTKATKSQVDAAIAPRK